MSKDNPNPVSLLEGISEMVFRICTLTGEILEYFAPDHFTLWLPKDQIVGFNILDLEGVIGTQSMLDKWRSSNKENLFNETHELEAVGMFFELKLKKSGKDEIFAIVKEITKQKKNELELEKKKKFIKDIENTLTEFTGKEYFDSLALHLNRSFNAHSVLIGEIRNEDGIRTISFSENKKIKDNFEYQVRHAPCEELLKSLLICYPEKVSKIFNKDEFLVKDKIEGYLGRVLLNDESKPVGVIIVLFKEPIKERELYENLLHLLSGRATAELKRELSERELKKSEAKFRDIFNSITDIYYRTNAKHEVVLISPSIEAVAGYKPDQVIGKPVSSFYADPSQQKMFIEKLIAAKSLKNFDLNLKKSNGDIIPVEINVNANFDEDGKFDGSKGIIRDISEPVKRQQELLENEKKFRSLFEDSSDAVIISDPKSHRILDVNQKTVEITGYQKEELLKKTVFDIRPKQNYAIDKKKFDKFLKAGSNFYESVFVTKSGDLVDVEGSAKFLELSNKKIIQAFIRDVTKRKKEEKIVKLNGAILEKMARESDIHEILNSACLGIEDIYSEMTCSILIYDKEQNWLNYGAGPSLPKYYTKSVHNFPVSANGCSCGTAVHSGQTTIVSDIQNSPLWKSKKDVAARAKLKACWSTPLMSSKKSILGTFAVYYKEKREPKKNEIELINNFSNLVGIALENEQNKRNLVSNEYRYRQLVNNSPIGILIHTKGIIKFVNTEVLRIGKAKDKEQLLGKSVMEFVIPKFIPDVKKRMKRAEEDKKIIPRIEEQFLCIDGSIIDVEVMGTPVSYQGEPSTQLVFYDITERKKAEKKLKISEERHRSLNDSVLDAIIISDGTGNVISWNQGAEKIFGYKEKEVLNKSVAVIIPKQFSDACIEGLEKIHESGKHRSVGNIIETQGINKKKKLFPIEISTSSWFIGNERFFSAIIRDISERKAIENKQKSLNEYLIKQNKQLEEFAHIASHNLRAPIANIESLLQLQMADGSKETSEFIFDQLNQVSKNLIETIDDLTEVLKTSWELNKKKQKLKFSSIFERTIASVNRKIEEYGIRVDSNFDAYDLIDYPKIYLESIMQNLVFNAIKYRNPNKKSWIKVFTTVDKKGLALHVQDNGLGIDMKKHGKKIFGLRKTFHKNEDARGVGLFITKAQVVSMGGDIEVASIPERGSKFSIYFNINNQ